MALSSSATYASREDKNVAVKEWIKNYLVMTIDVLLVILIGFAVYYIFRLGMSLVGRLWRFIGLAEADDKKTYVVAYETASCMGIPFYTLFILDLLLFLFIAGSEGYEFPLAVLSTLSVVNVGAIIVWIYLFKTKSKGLDERLLRRLNRVVVFALLANLLAAIALTALKSSLSACGLLMVLNLAFILAAIAFIIIIRILQRELLKRSVFGSSSPSYGGGMGCKGKSVWVWVFILFMTMTPILVLFVCIFIFPVAILSPMICIVECLGGGGDYYSSSLFGNYELGGMESPVFRHPDHKDFFISYVPKNRVVCPAAQLKHGHPAPAVWIPELATDANGKAEIPLPKAEALSGSVLFVGAGAKDGTFGFVSQDIEKLNNSENSGK